MNQLSGGKNSGLLLVSALVLALLFAVYYYVVQPKKEEVSNAESAVNQLQTDVSALKEDIALIEENRSKETVNLFALRQKVPQQRAMKELLLSIEEIEFVAQTRILSLEFNNYDSLVVESTLEDPNKPEETEAGQTDGATEQAVSSEEESTESVLPVSSITRETLPAELKMITFNVEVAALDQTQIEQFLKEIESLERVMRVDAIHYALPGEEAALAEDQLDIVTADIQVTTFYYEGT
ncbi:MAG: potassium transporter [Solibacillus sp.]